MRIELIHQKDCKKNNLITDLSTGEVACQTCGAVITEKSVERGPEISGTTKEEFMNNTRVGRKISLKMADMGLSTVIEEKDKDSTGKSLSFENRRVFYRLRMWDRNSRSAVTEKSFQKAFTLLDGIRAKLALPESVVEETAYLFRKIAGMKVLGGRSTTGMLCATVYLACRLTNTPRTIQDVAQAGNIKKKTLQRIYRFLVNELDLYPRSYNPSEFISRIANAVKASEKTKRLAVKILEISNAKEISTSKNPIAMAAAAIHLAALKNSEKISQIKIAEISGVSAVTIRDRAKEVMKGMGGEI